MAAGLVWRHRPSARSHIITSLDEEIREGARRANRQRQQYVYPSSDAVTMIFSCVATLSTSTLPKHNAAIGALWPTKSVLGTSFVEVEIDIMVIAPVERFCSFVKTDPPMPYIKV